MSEIKNPILDSHKEMHPAYFSNSFPGLNEEEKRPGDELRIFFRTQILYLIVRATSTFART